MEKDPTQVFLDPMGVPHIFAKTDADAMFASGYVMAKMRLFQLETVRRQARGELSEILGEKSLRTDLLSRTMQFGEYGKASRQAMQADFPLEARLIESFVRGINHHIDQVLQGQVPLPVEMTEVGVSFLPTRWTDDDPYIVGKMLSFGMSSSFDSELLATLLRTLAPQFPAKFPFCMPTRNAFTMPDAKVQPTVVGEKTPPPRTDPPVWPWQSLQSWQRLSPDLGSNNWVVAASATETGTPMLAGDPHQPLGSPNRFFAQHLNSAEQGGSLDVVGFGFAGTPGVQLGHNRRLSWAATTNFADVMDFWEVPVPTQDQLVLGGRAVPVSYRQEKIRVRAEGGAVPSGAETDDVRVYEIADVPGLGVLLPDDVLGLPRVLLTSQRILFAWTGLAATHEAAMYLGLDRSRTLDEWEDAARRLEVGAVNLLSADQKNIRYRVSARVPDRSAAVAAGIEPWKLMDGKNPLALWTGKSLPDKHLPAAQDPPKGFLCTANNDPFGFTSNGKVNDDPFYYGYFYDPGDRAHRIETELARLVARGKVSQKDFETLQWDAHSALAEDLLAPLAVAVAAIDTDARLAAYKNRPELLALAAGLSAWDKQMRRDSPWPVVFFAFSHFAAKRGLSDTLGPLLPKLFEFEPAYALKPLRLALRGVPGTESLLGDRVPPVLVGALADTADWLKQRFAQVVPDAEKPYRWRQVHGATFDHVLAGSFHAGVFPVDGSVGTVNVSSSTMFDGKGQPKQQFTARQGSLFRMVVSFDSLGTPVATVNFPRGNSADPQSPFFANTHEAWLQGRHEKLLFSRSDIERQAVETWLVARDSNREATH